MISKLVPNSPGARLTRTLSAITEGHLCVGFIGGSITEAAPQNRWPEHLIGWLLGRLPDVDLRIENAAIGATESTLAVFRAEADITSRGCDLVFVEFAVNDAGLEPTLRANAREGLLRKLLESGADVVLVYTHAPGMLEPMMEGRIPDSIAGFQQLATHYHIPSLWVGLHALRANLAGRLPWLDWLPDNLHPEARGSLVYAEAIIDWLDTALSEAPGSTPKTLPEPLHPEHWGAAHRLPLSDIEHRSPWYLRRSTTLPWTEHVLTTTALDARLTVPFRGRVLTLTLDFGRHSGGVQWRFAGEEAWRDVDDLERPGWAPEWGWLRLSVLYDGPPVDTHVELRTTHGGASPELRVAWVGVVS